MASGSRHREAPSGHRCTEIVGKNEEDGWETIEEIRDGVETSESLVEGEQQRKGVVRRGSPICIAPGDDESLMTPYEKKLKIEEKVDMSIMLPNELWKKVIGNLDVHSLWNLRLNIRLNSLVQGELPHIPFLRITSKRGVPDDGCTLQTPLNPSADNDRTGNEFIMRLKLLQKYKIGMLQLEVAIEGRLQFRVDVWKAVADLHAHTVVSLGSYHTAEDLKIIVQNKQEFRIARTYWRKIFSSGFIDIIKMMYKREIVLKQFSAPVDYPIYDHLYRGIRKDLFLWPLLDVPHTYYDCTINQADFSMNLSYGGIDIKVKAIKEE